MLCYRTRKRRRMARQNGRRWLDRKGTRITDPRKRLRQVLPCRRREYADLLAIVAHGTRVVSTWMPREARAKKAPRSRSKANPCSADPRNAAFPWQIYLRRIFAFWLPTKLVEVCSVVLAPPRLTTKQAPKFAASKERPPFACTGFTKEEADFLIPSLGLPEVRHKSNLWRSLDRVVQTYPVLGTVQRSSHVAMRRTRRKPHTGQAGPYALSSTASSPSAFGKHATRC